MRHVSMAAPRHAIALLLLIALVAAATWCVADAHAGHDDIGPAHDLCIGTPGLPTATAPAAGLAVVGRAPIPAPPGVPVSALDVLELPPRR
jgi:hypothetical protein